jgi:hypothetical protein
MSEALVLSSIQLSAVSSQHSARKTFCFDLASEGGKHSLNLDNTIVKIVVVGLVNEIEIMSQKKVVFQFTRRTSRNIEKPLKLSIPAFSTPSAMLAGIEAAPRRI